AATGKNFLAVRIGDGETSGEAAGKQKAGFGLDPLNFHTTDIDELVDRRIGGCEGAGNNLLGDEVGVVRAECGRGNGNRPGSNADPAFPAFASLGAKVRAGQRCVAEGRIAEEVIDLAGSGRTKPLRVIGK